MKCRNGRLLVGGALVATFAACAVLAPLLAPADPYGLNLPASLQPPSPAHPLGTDELGRDVLSRIIHGARRSLLMGVVAVAAGGAAGVFLGALAGFHGGLLDELIMRVTDVLMAFPGFLLALGVALALGPGPGSVVLAVAVYSLPAFTRLARAQTAAVRVRDFVTAARALGARESYVLWRHVFPSTVGPIVVMATVRLSTAILTVSGLSFLGLGPQPPEPEWGAMLAAGREYLWVAPHLVVFPGAALALLVLGLNTLGDGLRDRWDAGGR